MDYVLEQIREIASKYDIEKAVLFGSRARGDNSEVSDYDIAVFENNLSDLDKAYFYSDIDDVETLKKIDIVFIDEHLSEEFIMNITREGIVIYEQNTNKIN